MLRRIATFLIPVFWPILALAQTAGTPQGFSFTKSTSQGDTSVFTGYRAEIHQTSTTVKKQDIGAPAPDASGTITYMNATFFQVPAGDYTLFLFAYGPAGDSAPATAPFTVASDGTITTPNAPGGISFIVCEPPVSSSEIVLWSTNATLTGTRWSRIADATAAGGSTLYNKNGAAKVTTALANPTDFVEMSFTAKAGVPYHIWLRMKADNNAYSNDSVYVQFNASVNANGQAIARIGTTTAWPVILEEGSGGDHGWGWNDNNYGGLGVNVYFAADGMQTLRIQPREDGIRIDQVVISPSTYLTTRPGAIKDDTTILQKTQ